MSLEPHKLDCWYFIIEIWRIYAMSLINLIVDIFPLRYEEYKPWVLQAGLLVFPYQNIQSLSHEPHKLDC